MTAVSEAFATSIEQIRKSWAMFLVFGALLIFLGIVCIGKAQTATTFSILALGWVLLISGLMWLINSFYSLSWHVFFLYLLNAVIRGVSGFLLIRHPDAGAQGVTFLLATLFMVGGLFRGIGASVIQFPRWGWTVFSSLVSFAFGIYLLATWPEATTYLIGILIGVDLILDGASLVGFAGAIHSLPAVQRRPA